MSQNSQKLDPKIVIKVAKMAKLYNNPPADFVDKFSNELGGILNFVKDLDEVNVQGIDPLASARTIKTSELRADEPAIDNEKYQKVRQNIISNFPKKQGNLLVVSGVFNS